MMAGCAQPGRAERVRRAEGYESREEEKQGKKEFSVFECLTKERNQDMTTVRDIRQIATFKCIGSWSYFRKISS